MVSTFILSLATYGQQEIDLERLADAYLGPTDQDADYESLLENLNQLYLDPLDLNSATPEQLELLFILDDAQIRNLLAYREKTGSLLSIYELQTIPGFDSAVVRDLIPFIQVHDRMFPGSSGSGVEPRRTRSDFIGRMIRRPPQDPDYGTMSYLIRARVRYARHFSVGAVLENDAGEAFRWDPRTRNEGPDYIGGYLQLLNKGPVRNLIIGNYSFQFGQGLALGNKFSLGKGTDPIGSVRRADIGFLPYSSAVETSAFRGAAATVDITRTLSISAFYSYAFRDAYTDNDTITSFITTGLHRSDAEIAKRKNTAEDFFGGVVGWKSEHLDLGGTFSRVTYSKPVFPASTHYHQFAFHGKTNTVGSVYFNARLGNITLFSEAASSGSGLGITSGVLASVSERMDFALHWRSYDKGFHSLYSNALSESTTPQNERGLYWGWRYRISRRYRFTGYVDLFRFPWLRYQTYRPSQGHEVFSRLTFTSPNKAEVYLQGREETKERNLSGNETSYEIGRVTKFNMRLNARYSANHILRMQTRIQESTYRASGRITKGVILAQDMTLTLSKVEVTARHALFDTDDYENRQYIFERDVWLSFSIPAYYGSGIHDYLLVKFQVSRHLDAWFRYGTTRYSRKPSQDGFAESINDIKFQVRLHW